jgi:glucan biosynthesis protein
LRRRLRPPFRRPHLLLTGRRVEIASLAAACLALVALLVPAASAAFGFDDVAQRAMTLAATAYKKADADLPKPLSELT